MSTSPQSTSTTDPILSVDVMDYWWILRRRYKLVLGIFIFVFSLSLVLNTEEKAVYESSCLLSIASRKPMASIDGTRIQWFGGSKSDLSTELQMIVHDSTILDNTVKRLKGTIESNGITLSNEEKRFISDLTPERLKGGMRAEKQAESDLVVISVRGAFPYYTQLAVNILAQVYREEFASSKTREALETRQFIDEQLLERKDNLKKVNLEKEESSKRLDRLLAGGVTTCEIKTGYGLDLETEIKMLEQLDEATPAPDVMRWWEKW